MSEDQGNRLSGIEQAFKESVDLLVSNFSLWVNLLRSPGATAAGLLSDSRTKHDAPSHTLFLLFSALLFTLAVPVGSQLDYPVRTPMWDYRASVEGPLLSFQYILRKSLPIWCFGYVVSLLAGMINEPIRRFSRMWTYVLGYLLIFNGLCIFVMNLIDLIASNDTDSHSPLVGSGDGLGFVVLLVSCFLIGYVLSGRFIWVSAKKLYPTIGRVRLGLIAVGGALAAGCFMLFAHHMAENPPLVNLSKGRLSVNVVQKTSVVESLGNIRIFYDLAIRNETDHDLIVSKKVGPGPMIWWDYNDDLENLSTDIQSYLDDGSFRLDSEWNIHLPDGSDLAVDAGENKTITIYTTLSNPVMYSAEKTGRRIVELGKLLREKEAPEEIAVVLEGLGRSSSVFKGLSHQWRPKKYNTGLSIVAHRIGGGESSSVYSVFLNRERL